MQALQQTLPGLEPWLNATDVGAGVQCQKNNPACVDTYKVDSQVYLSMLTSGVAGFLCFAGFCWLQSFISIYRGRLLSPQVAIKPPVYTGTGIAKYFYWLWVTITMSEKELLATAGMDALMFQRLIVLSMQFILPVTVVSCAVLIPIHATSTYLRETQPQHQFHVSSLMSLTMSNIPPKSSVLWVHFCLVWAYCLYAMWLLAMHYKWYMLLRQSYMTLGDSVSTWLGHTPGQQLQAEHDSVVLPQSSTQQQLLHPAWGFARCKPSEPGRAQQQPAELRGWKDAAAAPAAAAAAAAAASVSGHAIELAAYPTLESLHSSELHLPPDPLAEQHQRRLSGGSPFAAPGQQQQQGEAGRGPPEDAAAVYCSAGTGTTASPADSRLTSRQTSLKALLPASHQRSSSSSKAGAEQTGRRSLGFFSAGSHQQQAGGGARYARAASSSAGGGAADPDAEPGLAPEQDGIALSATASAGAAGSGPSWRRGKDGSSSAAAHLRSDRAAVLQRQQQLREQQARAAEAARAAAEVIGADVEWWRFKTGDPLLDRHVVAVDVAADLAWAGSSGSSAERLNLWWEIAPDTRQQQQQAALSASCGSGGAAGAAGSSGAVAAAGSAAVAAAAAAVAEAELQGPSNLMPVPRTSLLFDRRSLRARKPSVRFRNTVHVPGLQGGLVPLHVSNYAVLVTDVPQVAEFVDEVDGCEPPARQRLHRPHASPLLRLLHALVWGWPCLLGVDDTVEMTRNWTNNCNQFSESMRQLLPHQQQQLLAAQQQRRLGATTAGDHEGDDEADKEGAAASRSPSRESSFFGSPDGSQSSSGGSSSSSSARQLLVENTFRQLFPEDFHAVLPIRKHKAVELLLRQWNADQQKYIQRRALLQLRLSKEAAVAAAAAEADAAAAGDVEGGGDSAGSHINITISSGGGGGVEQQRQAAGAGSAAALASPGCQPSSQRRRQPHAADLVAQYTADASFTTASAAAAAAAVGVDGQSPDGGSSAAGLLAAAESHVLPEDPCWTAHLPPLTPRPCLPDNATQQPRLVSQEEAEGATPCGRTCAALAGCLCCCRRGDGRGDGSGAGPGQQQDDDAASVSSVVEGLEGQRQALIDLEASILEAQKKVLSGPDTGSYVVLFKTPQAATLAAHSSVFPQGGGSLEAFKVQPAPGPEDMLWQALWKTPSQRRDQLPRCLFWYGVLYLVPTGIFTAALNSISYGVCNSPSLQDRMTWFCHTRLLQFLFTVVLPFVLLMVWQNAVIPANLYKLELRRSAAVSCSQMERNILLIYVGWEIVNLFLGGVLSASVTSQIKMLTDNPDKWALLLGAAFPNSSNFFLNYVIARAFMMNLFRLLMPHGGMWRWIGQMLFTGGTSFRHAATERYRAFIIYPASIRYGREPGLVLLILLIGIAYCVAAPLITPFVLAYMATAYLIWRYQLIYVCVRCYESGGKHWPVYNGIINWCLGLFVVFSSSMFIFKEANVQGVLVLPILPLLYLFARWCRYTYSSRVEQPPLWLAHEAPRTEIDPLVYTPAALQPHAQGWYFELGKAWVRWGVPAFV